jgi:hypothetical protein
MDRRQFTEAVEFFSLARRFYEDLDDHLVAEECGFAIALAQRAISDAERERKSEDTKRADAPDPALHDADSDRGARATADHGARAKDVSMSAA